MKTRIIRILIVEDHPILRRGLREILTEAYPLATFGEAVDAASALEQCRMKSWDLITLDIKMPGRDGFTLLNDLRKLRPRPKVLVVSAYPEAEYGVRSIQGGAAGFLGKSQAPDELVAAVARILNGGKYITTALAEQLAGVVSHDLEPKPHDGLSARELQVLRMVAGGASTKSIAAELNLSEKTISTYRSRIAGKTGFSTSVGLTRYALQRGIA